MAQKQFSDQDVDSLLNTTHGTKPTVVHYLKKANDAGQRLKLNIGGQNPLAIVHEATTMIAAVERAYKLLADDNKVLPAEKKKSS